MNKLGKTVTRVLPLAAAFLAGSVVAVYSTADPGPCDWTEYSETSVFSATADGEATPLETLAKVPNISELKIPDASVKETSGPNRYVSIGEDKSGYLAYTIFIDDVDRIKVAIAQNDDGTYRLEAFQTCWGVK